MKRRPGLSLVELLVSISVMLLLILIISNVFIGSSRFFTAEQLRIDVGGNASRALTTVDAILRQGKNILSSAVYNTVTYTTGDTVVVLTEPSLLADGTASLTQVDTLILYLDTSDPQNGILRLITAAVGSDSTRQVGSRDLVQGVEDIYFRYVTDTPTDSTIVTATITTQTTVNQRPFTTATIFNATLRNHP